MLCVAIHQNRRKIGKTGEYEGEAVESRDIADPWQTIRRHLPAYNSDASLQQ
jgi:hypothetical protein